MIRRLKPADSHSLEKMLDKIEIFSKGEIGVAKELVKIAAADIQQTDYNFFVFENDGMILGYHCTGRRPLTDGVFDLYWIVTDPEH